MLGEIKNFLPGDIDLTDDEIFRERSVVTRGKRYDRNLLPWESLDGSYSYLGTTTNSISTWISSSFIDDSDIITEFSNGDINVRFDSIESDDSINIISSQTSNRSTWTMSFTSSTTSSRPITLSYNDDDHIITTSVKNYIPSSVSVYKKRNSYQPLSEEYEEYKRLYGDLPISPVFNGNISKFKDMNTHNLPNDLKHDYKNKIQPIKNAISFLDDLKYDWTVQVKGVEYYFETNRHGMLVNYARLNRIISKYLWGEDMDYYFDRARLPWEDGRSRITIDRNNNFIVSA